jgi:hypothetical protein
MPPLADVVGRVVAAPKPVICLDTCDILEVVQCLDWERPSAARNTACVASARRLLTTLVADPDRALVVVTDLVVTEWHQNIAEIRDHALRFLSQVDGVVRRAHQAAMAAGTTLAAYTDLSASTLVDDLVELSRALLDQATRIDLEPPTLDLAVQRVLARRRPSQDGHLKDSIHFEHYLELARRFRAAGFAEECVFVSRNKKDFWHGQQPSVHPDLAPEIDDPAVRLRFFGSLEAALGHLHL